MKNILVTFLILLITFYGCSKGEFEFSDKAKITSIKLNSNGDIAVLYKSNEIVNVYNFEKLTKTFERESYFIKVKGKRNIIGPFYKVSQFGLAENTNVFYVVGNNPTIGWIVQINDRKLGAYSYVTEIKVSKDGKRFGIIYNVGGEFDGTNLIGGKFYVNIDGTDYGPYDLAQSLTFSEDGDSYFFIYKNNKYWYVNENGIDHNVFDEVVLPIFLSGYNVNLIYAYRIRNNYFFNSGQKLETKSKPFRILVSEKGIGSIYIDKTNVILEIGDLTLTNDILTNIVLQDEGTIVFSSNQDYYVFYNNGLLGPYPRVEKVGTYDDKLVLKCISNESNYIYFGSEILGPYEIADFSVNSNEVIVGYVEGNKVKTKLIK
ncbi:MAG: hypothetical protein ACP5KI_00440 [Brevinematia bacterium]